MFYEILEVEVEKYIVPYTNIYVSLRTINLKNN